MESLNSMRFEMKKKNKYYNELHLHVYIVYITHVSSCYNICKHP